MNFIETLNNVGGVKPCPTCEDNGGPFIEEGDDTYVCENCHGTGHIIDLSPLLAKPSKLADVVISLLIKGPIDGIPARNITDLLVSKSLVGVPDKMEFCGDRSIYIVGPQRAHSLVYEVSRQLGGNAVVVEFYPRDDYEPTLSFPIPSDATVLLVTDKVNEKEMIEVVKTTIPDVLSHRTTGGRVLPYVLSLISSTHELIIPADKNFVAGSLSIISLHKE